MLASPRSNFPPLSFSWDLLSPADQAPCSPLLIRDLSEAPSQVTLVIQASLCVVLARINRGLNIHQGI